MTLSAFPPVFSSYFARSFGGSSLQQSPLEERGEAGTKWSVCCFPPFSHREEKIPFDASVGIIQSWLLLSPGLATAKSGRRKRFKLSLSPG